MKYSPLTIEVPASSANLGPGFDCLGLALNIIDTVHVEPDEARDDIRLVEVSGQPAPYLDASENLICRGYRAWGDHAGVRLPGARFRLESRIPVGKGFGSSGAALVAGLAAGAAITETKDERAAVLQVAGTIEGHADNAGAAVMGGVIASYMDGAEVRALHVANHLTLGVALFVPDAPLLTADARAAIPDTVPLRDAVFDVSRVAYLTTALIWGRWDLIGPAMCDRLHQPYRAGILPALDPVIAAAREAGAYGAALSGGGPSVIALGPADNAAEFSAAMEKRARELDWSGKGIVTAVREHGYVVKDLNEAGQ
jgi:homoserine kinase